MRNLILVCFLFLPNILSSNSTPVILLHNDKFITIMNESMIKKVFTLQETRWPNGDLIHVHIQPIDSSQNKYFISSRLHMPIHKYKSLLDQIRTTPNEFSLTEVGSEGEMVKDIKNKQNSIGYSNNQIIGNGRDILVISDAVF